MLTLAGKDDLLPQYYSILVLGVNRNELMKGPKGVIRKRPKATRFLDYIEHSPENQNSLFVIYTTPTPTSCSRRRIYTGPS